MNLHVQTQTLQINNIPLSKLQVLAERARQSGATTEEYAWRLIVEGLETPYQSSDDALQSTETEKIVATPRVVTEWYGRQEDAELFPDLSYWLSQDDAAKFEAAWEMVIEAHQIKGEDISESRLQRTVGGLQRRTS